MEPTSNWTLDIKGSSDLDLQFSMGDGLRVGFLLWVWLNFVLPEIEVRKALLKGA